MTAAMQPCGQQYSLHKITSKHAFHQPRVVLPAIMSAIMHAGLPWVLSADRLTLLNNSVLFLSLHKKSQEHVRHEGGPAIGIQSLSDPVYIFISGISCLLASATLALNPQALQNV